MPIHSFEILNFAWVPCTLRKTAIEALECANSFPFRTYLPWIVSTVLETAEREGAATIVELGAGSAPVTRRLLRHASAQQLEFIVCDLYPDTELYEELQRESRGRVKPVFSALDFSKPQVWPDKAILVLSAALHELPAIDRERTLQALLLSGRSVLIFEPLRCTPLSIAIAAFAFVPGVLAPLRLIFRKGQLRRIFWSWLIPLCPLIMSWDGIVSALRQWSDREWRAVLAKNSPKHRIRLSSSLFTQSVSLLPVREALDIAN